MTLLKVPRDVPDDKLVLLSDILPTAWCSLLTLPELPCTAESLLSRSPEFCSSSISACAAANIPATQLVRPAWVSTSLKFS